MTILNDLQQTGRAAANDYQSWEHPVRGGRVRRRPVDRPFPAGPPVGSFRYQGHGLKVSAARHPARSDRTSGTLSGRSVSTRVTVALAGLAALFTVWLGALAQAGVDRTSAPVASLERLAVVQVQAGETLQQLAGRIAPGTSVESVAQRIRDLNELDSSAVEAGQTLIAPVG